MIAPLGGTAPPAQERGVVGETPNLAARLQALSTPNTLVIGEATRRQIGGLFELEAVETSHHRAPVHACTTPPRARLPTRSGEGLIRYPRNPAER